MIVTVGKVSLNVTAVDKRHRHVPSLLRGGEILIFVIITAPADTIALVFIQVGGMRRLVKEAYVVIHESRRQLTDLNVHTYIPFHDMDWRASLIYMIRGGHIYLYHMPHLIDKPEELILIFIR